MVTYQEGVGWKCHKHGPFDGGPEPSNSQGVWWPWPDCPKCKATAEKDLCRECEKHPASIDFAEGTIAWVHGFTLRICRCCYLAKIEETWKNVQANREQLIADLQANPCGDPTEPESL